MYLFNLIAYLFIGGMRRPTKMSGEASAPPQPPRGGVPVRCERWFVVEALVQELFYYRIAHGVWLRGSTTPLGLSLAWWWTVVLGPRVPLVAVLDATPYKL